LAKLVSLLEVSEENFELFEREFYKVKSEAFQQGIQKTQKDIYRKETFGCSDIFNEKNKEQIRNTTILNAQKKWNF
jgi:hypothetical protein